MADFRNRLFSLAAVAATFAGAALAQPSISSTTATPGFVRSEGTTEQLNPITINLTSAPTGPVTLTLYLSPALPVTSKVLSTSTGVTEAVAVSGGVTATSTIGGNGQINFTFPSTPTGTSIVISNVRVNATSLASTTGLPPNVTAQAFLGGAGVVPGSTSSVTVAFVQSGLGATKVYRSTYTTATPGPAPATTAGAGSFTICNAIAAQSSTLPTPAFVVQINEGFAQAFKSFSQESSAVATSTTNAVNSGTRLAVTFGNLPSGTGLSIYVPTSVMSAVAGSPAMLTLVSSATAASTSSTLPTVPATTGTSYALVSTATGGVAPVTASGGTATAYYEVSAGDLSNTDMFNVPVFFIAAANAITANGTVSVSVSFAPVGAGTVPNFISSASTSAVSASSFTLCTTSLLFPFVTNAAGFDTGLAVANTSLDPFGTNGAVSQAGTCTMNFYGATSPAAVTSASVAAGSVYTGLVSSLAPGFQGYLIAQCNFQFAHGFAFITDGFGGPGRGLSQGYLALVIPDTNQQTRRNNPAGESLTN